MNDNVKLHLKAIGVGIGILAAIGIVITIMIKFPILFLLAFICVIGWGIGMFVLSVLEARAAEKEQERVAEERRKARGW